MTGYLVHPQQLVFRAKAVIEGFTSIVEKHSISEANLLQTSLEVVEDWSNDWDEDHGFGSSDGTFMLKEFIDNVISQFTDGAYFTDFKPTLKVFKR